MQSFRLDDFQAPPASSSDASRSIMYHCRMQYLKSRDGHSVPSRRPRRKSSIDLFDVGSERSDTAQFACLDERIHGPCSPKILIPPSELMTRPHAFRQAYWKHHCKPTVRAIEKLEIHQMDERKERLNQKRKEILAKIRSKEKARREADIRRRAERVLNPGSISGMESEESGDESDSDLEEQLAMMSALSSPDKVATSSTSSPGHRPSKKTLRASLGLMPKNRRTITGAAGHQLQRDALRAADEDSGVDDSFSFLSEWASMDEKKIRW